ncbi:MAG: hypothetical protein ABH878_05100 [bacterium]
MPSPKKKTSRNTWARIAAFFVLKRLKAVPDSPLDFIRLLLMPEDWLLVMPVEATAFDLVMPYCLQLQERNKVVRLNLLVPDEFRHWVKTTHKLKVQPYHKQDLHIGIFPRSSLLQRLRNLHPTVVVDLSPMPTPLSLSVCGLSGASIRGTFSRNVGDTIFNFIVESRAVELKDRYNALFTYLA